MNKESWDNYMEVIGKGKPLPVAIADEWQCLYCKAEISFVVRAKNVNPMSDGELIWVLNKQQNEIKWCDKCERNQVFKFCGYHELKNEIKLLTASDE